MISPNLRILCVDDDKDNSELVSLMLRRSNLNCEVTSVQSVAEALWLAKTNEFDLYVLAYKYLVMTSVDLCRAIRLSDAHTPIMFFTGEARERERQEVMDAGANAYLIKPMDLKKLADAAKRLLGTARLSARHAARSSNASVASETRLSRES